MENKIAEVVLTSAAWLSLIPIAYLTVGVFLNSLKSRPGNNHQNQNDYTPKPTPPVVMGSPQDTEFDQRPVGRPVQHGGTRRRSGK